MNSKSVENSVSVCLFVCAFLCGPLCSASDLDFTIAAGETIWTESSYKYRPTGLVRTLERSGFRLVDHWIDVADGFMLTLVRAV